MSKSLKRVKAALVDLGLTIDVIETGTAKTAEQAAHEMGCDTNQIGKSIILKGVTSDQLYLFITAGAQKVDAEKAAELAREQLERAEAQIIRSITGFAIGGVSPVGHLNTITSFMDDTLFEYDTIYVAAGTPHHVFPIAPDALLSATNAQKSIFSK